MELYSMLTFLTFWLTLHGFCESDIGLGYKLTLAVPAAYATGFIGKAYLTVNYQTEPNFKAALSVEAIGGRYSCSLQVFLGDVKVWSSGHYSWFYVEDSCVLELTKDGDLQLRSSKDQRIGWRSGTSGQGVQRLLMQRIGNLALLDAPGHIKWQTFNFPTDVMLWGQTLDVATRLTSFASNSTLFYSFEIQHDKLALYMNIGTLKYAYWEFKPSGNRNINFLRLGSTALEIFDDYSHKIAQIPSKGTQPLRFLALGNRRGNMGLYFYSPQKRKFESSFQALNRICDFPRACNPYGICTVSNSCACIKLMSKKKKEISFCSKGMMNAELCDKGTEMEMLELKGVTTVLRDRAKMVNISKETCAGLCLNDCKCVAALYSWVDGTECSFYGVVMGVKEVERGSRLSYMVKVPKGMRVGHGKSSGVKRWILILVGVVDGFIILLVLMGVSYYLIWKRKRNSSGTEE